MVRNILLERASRRVPGPLAAMQATSARLVETAGFSPNPGALRMWSFVAPTCLARAPLVVVLHGCGQTALGFDRGTGWSALAEAQGFAVLFPEQVAANNGSTCFNWFVPADVGRGKGEAASIVAMVERMVVDHDLDRSRVFIAGLSAGGAMAASLLAAYPDVFAAGAINAGLPCGAAASLGEALPAMAHTQARDRAAWGDKARAASPGTTRWPRVSIWHGADDRVVAFANATALADQWTDLHGLTKAETVPGTAVPVTRWRDAQGRVAVELVTLPGMGHGAAITTAPDSVAPGTAAPFLLPAPVSSTEQAARFFGILRQERVPSRAEPRKVDPIGSVVETVTQQMKRLFGGLPGL